jgi:hypothetical protein
MRRRQISNQQKFFGATEPELLPATDGEINFLWSFIQGSIMIPETWNALLRNYGFCERHAWIHVGVEMSFRGEYLLGPTILYAGLIERAFRAASTSRSAIRQLRAAGPCLVCAVNAKNASAGASPQALLNRGRDAGELRNFAGKLEPIWRDSVCRDCSGHESSATAPNRCRQHLLAAIKERVAIDMAAQGDLLQDLSARLCRYERSFLAGGPKVSDQDRAALITAVGWCSGWRPVLMQLARGSAQNV